MTHFLTIIDTNFANDKNWIFKLKDGEGGIHFIMTGKFYKDHQLKSPITRQHLDSYDKGQTLFSVSTLIDGVNVVTDVTGHQ